MKNFRYFFQKNWRVKWNIQKHNKCSSSKEFSENNEGHMHVNNINYANGKEKQISIVETSIKRSDSGNHINEHEAYNEVSPTLLSQVIGALACALVQLGLGVVFGFTGVILPALTNANSTDIYLNTDDVALFSSLNNIGTIMGAASAGIIMTFIGQRVVLLITLPLGASAWILMAYSYTYFWLIFSRFISGLAVGAYMTATHNYVAEISHTSVRGRLLATNDMFRQIGGLFVYVIGSTALKWRNVGLVCGIIPLIPPFVILLFLPDSPRWLATVNRKEETIKSLKFFRGSHYDVEKELNEILSQINKTSSNSCIQAIKVFKDKIILKRFIILCVLSLFIHFTGNVVTMSYSVVIFKATNTDIDEYTITMISASMRVFGAFTYFIIADKIRRKVLLITPLLISGLSISSLGLYFYLMLHYDVQNFYWVPSTTMVVYLYSTGMYYPVFMLIRTELLPTSIRSFATGLLLTLLSMGMFLTVFFYPYMIESIGHHVTFWFYGIICLFIAMIVLFLIPETKDKTLEEIEVIK